MQVHLRYGPGHTSTHTQAPIYVTAALRVLQLIWRPYPRAAKVAPPPQHPLPAGSALAWAPGRGALPLNLARPGQLGTGWSLWAEPMLPEGSFEDLLTLLQPLGPELHVPGCTRASLGRDVPPAVSHLPHHRLLPQLVEHSQALLEFSFALQFSLEHLLLI